MSLEMKFVHIQPGTFTMGGTRQKDNPIRRVTITKGFRMASTPVTQAQWQAIMGTNPSYFQGEDRPVEKVSWSECQEFCRKISERMGRAMRLPTEAEWEYACRAGTLTDYWNGNGVESLKLVGWFNGTSEKDSLRNEKEANRFDKKPYEHECSRQCWALNHETRPVAKLPANAWGIHDVHGNVWEWCNDWYGPLPADPQIDPTGALGGECRVLRGGSFGSEAEGCFSACRGYVRPDSRGMTIGLRVCYNKD